MSARPLLLDAHLPPSLCPWIETTFKVRCKHVRDLGLRESDDGSIVELARREGAAMLSKDGDLPARVEVVGPPPWLILLTCGNATNARLRQALSEQLPSALALLGDDVAVVFLTAD